MKPSRVASSSRAAVALVNDVGPQHARLQGGEKRRVLRQDTLSPSVVTAITSSASPSKTTASGVIELERDGVSHA